MRPPYVPIGYDPLPTARTLVWKPSDAPLEPCESLLDDVVASVETCLDHPLTCKLNVVIYPSNADARTALGRSLPASMLLAPWQTASAALIAVQSAAAHSLNADPARMRRHLAHELAHVAAALRTRSEKRLGDNNRSMRVRPWVNEGFACVVAALVCDRRELLNRAREASGEVFDLDAALDDPVS